MALAWYPDGWEYIRDAGVALWGVEAGRIGWGRLYMEPVELAGAGIDDMVRLMARRQQREP